MLFMAVSLFAVADSKAQVSAGIYIGTRPARPRGVVVVRPPRPTPHHVWVDEEWTPNGGTYVYHAGYWAVPPHPGGVWVKGHWWHRYGRGWKFIPGHWA